MQAEKILSRIAIVIATVLLIAAVYGAFAVYDYFFPVAEPVICPIEDGVNTITLAKSKSAAIMVDTACFADLLQHISSTEPTRKWSVQDYPAVKDCYIIEVNTLDRMHRYFVYVENSQVYLESPYEGVYKSNHQFLKFIQTLFQE